MKKAGRQSQTDSNNRDNGRPGRNTSEAVGSEKGTGQQGEVKYSKTNPDNTAKRKEITSLVILSLLRITRSALSMSSLSR